MLMEDKYAESDSRLRKAVLQLLPSPESQRECWELVKRLRFYRHLFVHTYVHLVSCCQSRFLDRLVFAVTTTWGGWDSADQLVHHYTIEKTFHSFWVDCTCRQHRSLLNQQLHISDDDSDLLCTVLYCDKNPKLYELSKSSFERSEQVIELIWQFLSRRQKDVISRRLRSCIYRLARKSAYFPRDLQINSASITYDRSITAGANGIVSTAKLNGQGVVMKRISYRSAADRKECHRLFANEAILWKTLLHKNIVPFLGVVFEEHCISLVSPYYKNGSIPRYMKGYNPQKWPVLATKLGKGLARALDFIHCHDPPIIHGDIKGDNVVVDDDGNPRLTDFGQSHSSDSGKYLDSSRVGLATHSPMHWMAPELFAEEDNIRMTEKSDIYAFGCVLYEMVSGNIPFGGLSPAELIRHVQRGERPDIPYSAGRTLLTAIEKCWRRHPENRPSASALVTSLH